MGRSPCCAKEELNRGAWTPSEDRILKDYIISHGEGKWRSLSKKAGLKRCGKSCRLRWLNYLRPDIKRGNITDDEEDLIIRLHKLLGNRWSLIAGRLPGRTDNEIKNYWNTNIVKKIEGDQSSYCGTKCKQSSTRSRSAVQNLRSDKPMGPPSPQKVGSCAVRTKAIRCTKVFINADLQSSSTQQPGIMPMKAPASCADAIDDFITTHTNDRNVGPEPSSGGVVRVSPPTFSGEEGYSSGFMMDFEMDDKFISDFLNTDFVGLEHVFDKGVEQGTNTETNNEANFFSPNSSQSALLHDHSEDLGWMATLLDPAMDWLHEGQ